MFYIKAIPLLFVGLFTQQSIAQNMPLPELVGVTNAQATAINKNKNPTLTNNQITPNAQKSLPQLSGATLNQNSYKNTPEMVGINPNNYKPLQKIAVPQLVNKSEITSNTPNQNALGKPLHIDGRNQKIQKN